MYKRLTEINGKPSNYNPKMIKIADCPAFRKSFHHLKLKEISKIEANQKVGLHIENCKSSYDTAKLRESYKQQLRYKANISQAKRGILSRNGIANLQPGYS